MSGRDRKRSPGPEARRRRDEQTWAQVSTPQPQSKEREPVKPPLLASASRTHAGTLLTWPPCATKTRCASSASLARQNRATHLSEMNAMLFGCDKRARRFRIHAYAARPPDFSPDPARHLNSHESSPLLFDNST